MLFHKRELLRMLSLAFGSSVIVGRNQLVAQTATPPTEKVTGIGGLFFRAHDPKALGRWYQQHLGIALTPSSAGDRVWEQEAGPTVFAPFKETTDYFGDLQKSWMVNFRVRDLDKMAAQLQAAGIAVKIDPQSSSLGRFARLHDPEGNPIELWQPKVPDAKS